MKRFLVFILVVSTMIFMFFLSSGSAISCTTDADCNDGNICTEDSCVSGSCVFSFSCVDDACCDDGVFCNGEERCHISGSCLAGTPVDCDDGIQCTVDSCKNEIADCEHDVPDVDGDGHHDANCVDNSGMPLGDDCDDQDGNRHPGMTEVCDLDDEDCDPATFESGDGDMDQDGFASALCCNGTNCGNDCNDMNISIHPIQNEICNGVDDDCDGMVDKPSEEGASDGSVFVFITTPQFVDGDGDGYGNPSQMENQCPGTPGYSTLGNDCNDADPFIVPGTMICHPTDQTKLMICGFGGVYTEVSCPTQPKTTCITQPNGTGFCQPKK